MLTLKAAEKLRDKLAVAVSVQAATDWAPTFRKDPKQFKKLLEAEARLERKLRRYFKELANERVVDWVNWVKYHAEITDGLKAAKPKVNVIVELSDDQIGTEVGITTKVVLEELTTIVAAGASAQITQSKIPVADLGTLVSRVAAQRAGDLATQMTQTTVDKVRASIETSLKLGETADEAKARLTDFIDDDAKAETVAKTESANAWRRGVLETGKESGAVSKTWHVEGDPCEICDSMDGQTVGLDEDFEDLNSDTYSGEDGAHPRCKCDVSMNYNQAND